MPLDVLGHHDRIVDDNAHHHREADHRHDVQGEVEHVKHGERADDGGWNPDPHPQAKAQVQQQQHHDEHQRRADQGAVRNRHERLLDREHAVHPQVQFHSCRRVIGREVGFHFVAHFLRVHAIGRADLDEHRRHAIDGIDEGIVHEGVPYDSDVAEPHDRSIGLAEDDDVGELGAGVALLQHTQDEGAGIGAQLAAGKVDGRVADAADHVVHRQVMAAERRLVEVHLNLPLASPVELHHGHLGQEEKLLAQFVRRQSQFMLACRRRSEHQGQRTAKDLVADDFGLVRSRRREILDALHRRPHGVELGDGVLPLFEFDDHFASAFPGIGRDAVHAVESREALLDAPEDVFLHFSRSRPVVRHGDRDSAQVHGRVAFHGRVEKRDQAKSEQSKGAKHDGDAVARHVLEDRLGALHVGHASAATAGRDACSRAFTSSTIMSTDGSRNKRPTPANINPKVRLTTSGIRN